MATFRHYRANCAAKAMTDPINQYFQMMPRQSGTTPLHMAASGNNVPLLLDNLMMGVDVNSVNRRGATPLHTAAFEGHEQVAALLLDRGANPDAVNSCGGTPLHNAAHEGKVRIIGILLDKGANVNAMNNAGCTPLDEAINRLCWDTDTAAASLLVERGALTACQVENIRTNYGWH